MATTLDVDSVFMSFPLKLQSTLKNEIKQRKVSFEKCGFNVLFIYETWSFLIVEVRATRGSAHS